MTVSGKVSCKSAAPELMLLKLLPHGTFLLTQMANPETLCQPFLAQEVKREKAPGDASPATFENAYQLFRGTR